MRILFIAEPYMDLHLPIIQELEEQGHEVIYIRDIHLSFDCKEGWRGKKDRALKYLKAVILRSYQRYWSKMLSSDKTLSYPFDLLLVINGCSFHPYLLKKLKRNSPHIKSILYLWDNSAFYDYFHYANVFDKVMTFDTSDAEKYRVDQLPFFFTKDMMPDSNQPKYLISTVGTNHSGRLELCKRIYQDIISRLNLSVNHQITKWHKANMVDGGGNPLYFKIIDKSLPEDEIVTHKRMSIMEVIDLMKNSHCILDTDRESQTGTTPRLIWALAMNKKVITTNKNIVNFVFYNPEQILVIDRYNPVIPDEFLFTPYPNNLAHDKIRSLRIDNWIKRLIEV